MKRFKKITALLTAAIMTTSAFATTAFAAEVSESDNEIIIDRDILTTYTKTVTVSSMGIGLDPGTNGYSDEIDFVVSGIPSGATVTKIEVIVGSYTNTGSGVIAVDGVYLEDPDGNSYNGVWSAGPKWTITNILSPYTTNGTWTFYVHGANISSYWYAYLQYNNVKLKITYTR